jgi:hypothetical protein
MKKTLLICLLACIFHFTIHAQAVYVDSNVGDDKNSGTNEFPVFSINKAAKIIRSWDNNIYVMKINPGIYVLDNLVSVDIEKAKTNKRIIIEAAILPDSTIWTPEKMPVIISTSKKGEISEDYNFVASFLINESHVTIRGIKFSGYPFYPNTKYFPIARFNKEITDLLVEQCMFVGNEHASPIQVGIIANGNGIKVDHCVFYGVRNTAVYWKNSGTEMKTGNSFTKCIVSEAYISAIWTSGTDTDFIFKHNIVTNCKFAWIKAASNTSNYSIDSSIVVNNQYFQGNEDKIPTPFPIGENNVIKEGEISLRMISENINDPLQFDYLHILPGTLGFDMGAGLFIKKRYNHAMY